MKVFVLSLASDVKKRAVFERHFSCTKLSFSFFDGVDGQELCRKPSASDKLLYMPLEESCLTPGEIGCALGHFAIYREIVDKNIPFALVMEDDAYIAQSDVTDFLNFLDAYGDGVPKNSVILLTSNVQYSPLARTNLAGVYGCYKSGNGTYGYLIDNEAARKLMTVVLPIRYEADFWKGLQYSAGIRIMVCKKSYVRNGDLLYTKSYIAHDRNKMKELRSDKQAPLFKEECKTLKYKWRNPIVKLVSFLGVMRFSS